MSTLTFNGQKLGQGYDGCTRNVHKFVLCNNRNFASFVGRIVDIKAHLQWTSARKKYEALVQAFVHSTHYPPKHMDGITS